MDQLPLARTERQDRGRRVACHISHPERGGVSGALDTAEESSEVAIACRQIGPIVFKEPINLNSAVALGISAWCAASFPFRG